MLNYSFYGRSFRTLMPSRDFEMNHSITARGGNWINHLWLSPLRTESVRQIQTTSDQQWRDVTPKEFKITRWLRRKKPLPRCFIAFHSLHHRFCALCLRFLSRKSRFLIMENSTRRERERGTHLVLERHGPLVGEAGPWASPLPAGRSVGLASPSSRTLRLGQPPRRGGGVQRSAADRWGHGTWDTQRGTDGHMSDGPLSGQKKAISFHMVVTRRRQ